MPNSIHNLIKYLNQVKELEGENLLLEEKIDLSVLRNAKQQQPSYELPKSLERDIKNSASSLNDSANKPALVPANSVDPNWRNLQDLAELKSSICNCMNCQLGATRNKFVFGEGNPNAELMIIGEAPGADEDEQGKPFIGRAGQLLTKILESINFSREDVFIANIIKCRPPANRRPMQSEVEQCEPYLQKQIELINPQFILALGLTAVDTLLKGKHTMRDVRGKIMLYQGRKLLVTYHPAALLRNPKWKKDVWEDVKYLRKLYEEYQIKK